MPFKRKSKKVFRKRSRRERSRMDKTRKFLIKKRHTRKRMKKFTNNNMRGGALTRGQAESLEALGYTVTLEGTEYIVRGIPNVELINTRLPRTARKDDRFKQFADYIRSLLSNSSVPIPDNLDDLALKYIAGCDLEINRTAEHIIHHLLSNPLANALEIQNFQDRTKKLGSFEDTTDGLKELNGEDNEENGVKVVIFEDLPHFNPEHLPDFDRSKRKEPSPENVLYKYVIIEENDALKIYYSVARGLYHFSYIDYYVKKNYNEDGSLRVNGSGQPRPVTHLFFVKNTSIPIEIMFRMSFGNSQVKPEWFRLLRDFASQNELDIRGFVTTHIDDIDPEGNQKYKNVLDAFGSPEKIIEGMIRLEDILAYRNYDDEWNTVIMGEEISHSCLTYELGVIAAGEFCMDANGYINYVDCWSGHFKTPFDRIHVVLDAFKQYDYTYLINFTDHLAKSVRDEKCNGQAADTRRQLAPSVTSTSNAKKLFLETK